MVSFGSYLLRVQQLVLSFPRKSVLKLRFIIERLDDLGLSSKENEEDDIELLVDPSSDGVDVVWDLISSNSSLWANIPNRTLAG